MSQYPKKIQFAGIDEQPTTEVVASVERDNQGEKL